MALETKTEVNVKQAVPFFGIANMQDSLRFNVDGLGFKMKRQWIDEGKLRWCWLEIGDAPLMLQEFRTASHDSWVPESKVGVGVSIYFVCHDAISLYRAFTARGINPRRPFVGNRMWVTGMTGQTADNKTDIGAQAKEALTRLLATLKAGGFTQDQVVEVNCLLGDAKDPKTFAAMNAGYKEVFQKDLPARTTVQGENAGNTLVEITMMAAR